MHNPFSGMRRGSAERRLPQRGDERARSEHRETIAPEALNRAAEPSVDQPCQPGSDGDKVSERDEMGEPRQPEVLLDDVEVGRCCVAEPRREAGSARRRHRRRDEHRDAQRDQPGRRAWRSVAPDDGADEPDREGELPREGIEEPAAGLGPVRKVKAEAARGGVDCDRRGEREETAAHRQRQRERRPQHQNDVERQNVEITELVGEHGKSRHAGQGGIEDERPAVRFDQIFDAAYPEGARENRQRGGGQRNMHTIEFQRAWRHPRTTAARPCLRARGR